MSELCLHDENATMAFAKELANQLKAGDVVFLSGDLGSGKTTWTRALLQHLGFAGLVKSPSYSILENYEINGLSFYHLDLYRLHENELAERGITDCFHSGAILLVEWPEKALASLPKPSYWLHFFHETASQRRVSFEKL